MGTERTYLMNPINGHFLFAAESGFGCLLDVLEAIIARGADINARDQSGRRTLMFSAIRASHMLKRMCRAHMRIIAALLRRNADAIGLDNRGSAHSTCQCEIAVEILPISSCHSAQGVR